MKAFSVRLLLISVLVLSLTALHETARAADKAAKATSPDGKLIAQASGDKISVSDAATQKEVLAMRGHTGAVHALAFSPDGRLLASGGQDKSIRIWSLPTGKELRVLQGHQAAIESITIAADGKTLTSRDGDRKRHVWDLATGKQFE